MILLFVLVSVHAKKYNWCCKVTARKTPLFDFDRNLEIPPRSLIAKAKVYWNEMDVSLGEIKKLRKQERMSENSSDRSRRLIRPFPRFTQNNSPQTVGPFCF